MKNTCKKQNTNHTKFTDKEIIALKGAYQEYLKNVMNQCLENSKFEEGVHDLFEMVIGEFEAIAENFEVWMTDAFHHALRRVKARQKV